MLSILLNVEEKFRIAKLARNLLVASITKDGEHEKRTNFCAVCNGKLGIIYYHPKPAWKIEGNLCKKCWDNRNRRGP